MRLIYYFKGMVFWIFAVAAGFIGAAVGAVLGAVLSLPLIAFSTGYAGPLIYAAIAVVYIATFTGFLWTFRKAFRYLMRIWMGSKTKPQSDKL